MYTKRFVFVADLHMPICFKFHSPNNMKWSNQQVTYYKVPRVNESFSVWQYLRILPCDTIYVTCPRRL